MYNPWQIHSKIANKNLSSNLFRVCTLVQKEVGGKIILKIIAWAGNFFRIFWSKSDATARLLESIPLLF